MRRGFTVSIVVSLAVLFLGALLASAGQVRVTISSNVFSPRAINCNVGDHVVWVWTGGTHTCTSGDSTFPSPDGTWESGLQAGVATINGSSFNWKSTGAATFLYYCLPHSPNMAGRVIVAASGIDVADLRITEVLYNSGTGTHLIEITNFGAANGNLGRYRLAISTTPVSIPLNDVLVGPGATLTIHANATGTNTATDLFLPTLPDLPASGALSLYAPNTKIGATALNDIKQIIDFVEWGAGGGANEGTAAGAAFWTGGEFVPAVAAGPSIEYCDTPNLRRGASHWFDNPTPNFSGAANNCLTPVRSTTWGRIKVLYR